MPTTIIIRDEATRGAILGALWEHLTEADHKIDGFSDGLYDLLQEGFRPDATEEDYRAMRARFDQLLAFLTDALGDVERVEGADLGTAVVLRAITKDKLVTELDSYRRWIEDGRYEFWGSTRRLGILARHDAVKALLVELGEPVVVA